MVKVKVILDSNSQPATTINSETDNQVKIPSRPILHSCCLFLWPFIVSWIIKWVYIIFLKLSLLVIFLPDTNNFINEILLGLIQNSMFCLVFEFNC